jgi:hypothetical protein
MSTRVIDGPIAQTIELGSGVASRSPVERGGSSS